jgi:hypothetical protein
MKYITPIVVIAVFFSIFIINAYNDLNITTANAEAEAFYTIAESVAQVVCVVGRGNAYAYGDYKNNNVGDIVLTIADIPQSDWENTWLPYIENKYAEVGIPVKLRFVDTTGSDTSLKPNGLGDHIYTIEVYNEKLKVYRYWRIGAIYIKVDMNPKPLGSYRCITITY